MDLFGTGRILMTSGFAAWTGIFSAEGEDWYARDKTHGGRPFRSRSPEGVHLHPNYGDDIRPRSTRRAGSCNGTYARIFGEKTVGVRLVYDWCTHF